MNTPPLPYAALLAALLLALPARAQQFTGAIKIGGAVTSLSGESRAETDFDLRAGLTGGVALGYDFGNGLLIQPEILYVVKGAYADTELVLDGEPRDIRARFDLTYLDVPVLLVYRFERRGIQPKLFAGPSVAYKLDARVRFRVRGSDGPTQSEEDESIEPIDYGAVVGAGAEFFISGQRVSFDVRALLGQANVRETAPELNNTGVAFFLGVVF